MDKFFRLKHAADSGIDAECFKKSLRDTHSFSRRGLAVPREFEIVWPGKSEVAADRLKGTVLLLKVLRCIRSVSPAGFAALGPLLDNTHKLLRIAKRQRAQKNCIHHTKHSNICANAERQNQNCDQREHRVTAHGAEGVAKVEPKNVESGKTAGVALVLLGLLYTAKLYTRLAPRILLGHSTFHVFLNGHGEMGLHLGVEFAIHLCVGE